MLVRGMKKHTYIVLIISCRVDKKLKSVSAARNSDFGLAVSSRDIVLAVKEVGGLEKTLDESTEDVGHGDERQAFFGNVDVSALDGDGNDEISALGTSLGVCDREEDSRDDGENSELG